jgi:HSP20 family protein
MSEDKKRRVRPLSDICEDSGRVILRLEMPGVRKDNLEVRVEKDELIITGKRESEKPDRRYLLRERTDADYAKVYTLDETIDHDSIEAEMDKGVLVVKLSLKESVKPKKISVKAG